MLYIRVKVGPQAPIYFTMPENATIRDLKVKLEEYVDVPKHRQEIITPERTLSDSDSLLDISGLVVDSDSEEELQPKAISLYDHHEFVAFVRILSEEEHKIHLLLDKETDVQNERNNDNLELFHRIRSPKGQISTIESEEILSLGGTLKSRGHDACEGSSSESTEERSKKSRMDACPLNKCKPNPKQCFAEVCQAAQESCKMSHNRCDSSAKGGGMAPFINILPENRRFMLVVSTACKPKCYCLLLTNFFEMFAEYRSTNKLRFNEVSPVTTYDGRLYVAPADEDTMEWVQEKVGQIGEPFVVESLLTFLNLNRCTVIWPKVVETCDPDTELVSIFKLLESQNCGVNTEKWSVIERTELDEASSDYVSGAVTNICANEKVDLYIDDESAEYIRDNCHQLRYCFWVIQFVFCE